jgi:ribonucleotide monophosphatase NagD (HAD superfamily)
LALDPRREFNMDKYKVILFDLDGTLSDPKVGK